MKVYRLIIDRKSSSHTIPPSFGHIHCCCILWWFISWPSLLKFAWQQIIWWNSLVIHNLIKSFLILLDNIFHKIILRLVGFLKFRICCGFRYQFSFSFHFVKLFSALMLYWPAIQPTICSMILGKIERLTFSEVIILGTDDLSSSFLLSISALWIVMHWVGFVSKINSAHQVIKSCILFSCKIERNHWSLRELLIFFVTSTAVFSLHNSQSMSHFE